MTSRRRWRRTDGFRPARISSESRSTQKCVRNRSTKSPLTILYEYAIICPRQCMRLCTICKYANLLHTSRGKSRFDRKIRADARSVGTLSSSFSERGAAVKYQVASSQLLAVSDPVCDRVSLAHSHACLGQPVLEVPLEPIENQVGILRDLNNPVSCLTNDLPSMNPVRLSSGFINLTSTRDDGEIIKREC